MIEPTLAHDMRIETVGQPGGTREVLLYVRGEPVSRVVIVPMLMRIGAAVVRMDGVGGVETEEGYRYRGYSRRVMEAALGQMRAGDAALSTLFGIQDFYQKFGFETCGPDYTVSLPIETDSNAGGLMPPRWQFRPLAIGDLPAVQRLYHRTTRRAAGALVRDDAGNDPTEMEQQAGDDADARRIGLRAWRRLETIAAEPGKDACRVLVDPRGTIAAYAWYGANWWMEVRREETPTAFHLAEAMARDAEAADALWAACRHWASEAGDAHETVAIATAPEGPVAWSAAYEGGQLQANYTRGGDFMGRVLDLDRLIWQLLPELTARVEATGLRFRGQITIGTEEGDTSLSINPHGASIAPASGKSNLTIDLPQAALARLCLGGFEPTDVLARLPHPPGPEAVELLMMLFPRRHPFISPMDRF